MTDIYVCLCLHLILWEEINVIVQLCQKFINSTAISFETFFFLKHSFSIFILFIWRLLVNRLNTVGIKENKKRVYRQNDSQSKALSCVDCTADMREWCPTCDWWVKVCTWRQYRSITKPAAHCVLDHVFCILLLLLWIWQNCGRTYVPDSMSRSRAHKKHMYESNKLTQGYERLAIVWVFIFHIKQNIESNMEIDQ